MCLMRTQPGKLPLTFGVVFRPGEISGGKAIDVLADGKGLNAQVDVKRTFPDRSVEHAVVSVLLDGTAVLLQSSVGLVVLSFYHPLMLAFSALLVAGIFFVVVFVVFRFLLFNLRFKFIIIAFFFIIILRFFVIF